MIEAQKAQQVARGGEADNVAAFVALGGQVWVMWVCAALKSMAGCVLWHRLLTAQLVAGGQWSQLPPDARHPQHCFCSLPCTRMQEDKGGQVSVERLARTLAAFELRIDLDRLLVGMHAACWWECIAWCSQPCRFATANLEPLCLPDPHATHLQSIPLRTNPLPCR